MSAARAGSPTACALLRSQCRPHSEGGCSNPSPAPFSYTAAPTFDINYTGTIQAYKSCPHLLALLPLVCT